MDSRAIKNRIGNKVLITLFILGISLPLLATFFGNAAGHFNMEEKRKLAALPAIHLTPEGINSFPMKFGKYFDDNFGMRERLIKLHNYIKGMIFGLSPARSAIIGKQGWLFLGDDNIVADYRHTHPFTENELRQWRDVLVAKRDWLAARGIEYLFVVAPDKHSIYSEFVPNHLNRVRPDSCLDQLLEYLKANSNIRILDLRPALLAEKVSVRVYHKTDTHWNERGAFVAYQQIMRRLSLKWPAMEPKTLADFQPVEEMVEGQDIANMMGLRTAIQEQVLRLVPKTRLCAQAVDLKLSPNFQWPAYPPDREAYARECNQKKTKAVFFQDSMGTALAPFVSEHFGRTAFIWDYPNYAVLKAAVEQEHPDLVIEERVERHLKGMRPDFDIPSDLVGTWFYIGNRVEIVHHSSGSVSLVNEHGSKTMGIIVGSKLIAEGWNVAGELASDRKSILWANGTIWTR